MNTLKKSLGWLWMLIAPAVIIFLVYEAIHKIAATPENIKANVMLQWSIILLIFVPICIGLFIFGKYATEGEYAHLPESSDDL